MSHFLTKYLGVLFVASCIVLQLCAFGELDNQEIEYSPRYVNSTNTHNLKAFHPETAFLAHTSVTHFVKVSIRHPYIVYIGQDVNHLTETFTSHVNTVIKQQAKISLLFAMAIKHYFVHQQYSDEPH